MKKQKIKQTKGITLVALIITIIILLILAGISISQLTENGLFEKSQESKIKTENAQELENTILSNYESMMSEYLPATTITKAQTEDMLSKKINSTIEDKYGNKITIPAGFKIKVDDDTNNATTVDKGIVIIDSNENEFVWIPVGTIYTNVEKTETKTIGFNRYTFDNDGSPTPQNDAVIGDYNCQELATSTYGNTTAKNIEEFKTSAVNNHGYYIGRYEARTETQRTFSSEPLLAITEKGTDYVYTYVTQLQAAELARNMYNNSKFTSDLINSYAWDTATLFLQTCGTNSTYSRQTSLNSTLAETGTNNTETKDVQCNVYDMASNIREWTTETSKKANEYDNVLSGVYRGGCYFSKGYYTINRYPQNVLYSFDYGFRPILYL